MNNFTTNTYEMKRDILNFSKKFQMAYINQIKSSCLIYYMA